MYIFLLFYYRYQEGQVKIAIIICQKTHHTRMYYNDRDEGIVINGCPGLVSDATSGGGNCIVSAELNEFYLNSHHALQVEPVTYAMLLHMHVAYLPFI